MCWSHSNAVHRGGLIKAGGSEPYDDLTQCMYHRNCVLKSYTDLCSPSCLQNREGPAVLTALAGPMQSYGQGNVSVVSPTAILLKGESSLWRARSTYFCCSGGRALSVGGQSVCAVQT